MKKKRFILMVVALLCMLMFFGCRNSQYAQQVDVEIGDDYFIATVNNILDNFDDFYGQTVKMEGVFFVHGTDPAFRMVARENAACCGLVGLLVEGLAVGEYPEGDSWVEAIGTLGRFEIGETSFMGIRLSSINVVDEEPGQRFVSH